MNPRSWFISGVALVAFMFFVGVAINVKTAGKIPANMSSNLPSNIQGLTTQVILERIHSVENYLSNRSLLTSGQCESELGKVYDEMNGLKLGQFSLPDLKANATKIIKEMFRVRIALRENFQSISNEKNSTVTKECAFMHRRLFRAMRIFEDYIGMLHEEVFRSQNLTFKEYDKDNIRRVFEGDEINFLWNDKYRPAEPLKYVPKSGDILLSRGSASVSAAIARITDEDTNFSHAGIVYIDPKTGIVETIEAHIEFGSLVANISEYRDLKARAVVFRFNDPDLSDTEDAKIAHEAAEKVRRIILDYKARYGKSRFPNVCYDFSMNIDNPTVFVPPRDPENSKCLFCSEVISLAYTLVNNGKYKVPKFLSPINPTNRKFLTSIGATSKETFAPADLEIDPLFDLVMEWRDYRRIHRSHIMDAILTSVYSWMDDYHYEFYVSSISQLKTRIAHVGRRIPFFDRALGLDEKFPLNMKKSALDAMLMLDETANQLAAVIDKSEKGEGITYTPKEMIEKLNQWRVQDAKDYETNKNYNKPADILMDQRVHHFLRAPKMKPGK